MLALHYCPSARFSLVVVVLESDDFIFDGIQQWTQIVENRLPEPAGKIRAQTTISKERKTCIV